MTQLCNTVTLLLLAGAMLLAAGCVLAPGEGDPTSVSSGHIQSKEITYYDDITFKDPVVAWQSNLTYPWKKVASNVLVFIDPGYPIYVHGNTREQLKEFHILTGVAISAENATTRFNLTNPSGHVIGDHLFLTIHVFPNSSTHIVDPYITEENARIEELHGVEAWVDVNNLERLAGLDGVESIRFVVRAEHS
jgi:hypothetical protein